jgi:hypothetical protein
VEDSWICNSSFETDWPYSNRMVFNVDEPEGVEMSVEEVPCYSQVSLVYTVNHKSL